MKRTVTVACLLSLGVVAASAAQSSRAGDPPRLIIASMTGEDSFRFYSYVESIQVP